MLNPAKAEWTSPEGADTVETLCWTLPADATYNAHRLLVGQEIKGAVLRRRNGNRFIK